MIIKLDVIRITPFLNNYIRFFSTGCGRSLIGRAYIEYGMCIRSLVAISRIGNYLRNCGAFCNFTQHTVTAALYAKHRQRSPRVAVYIFPSCSRQLLTINVSSVYFSVGISVVEVHNRTATVRQQIPTVCFLLWRTEMRSKGQ